MPKSQVTVFDPNDLYPIPEDLPVPVQLLSCEAVDVKFTYRNGPKAGQPGGFLKWEWEYLVTDGAYAGIKFRGNTEPKITNATEVDFLPLARPVIEALLGRQLAVGEEIDTDVLIGARGLATVRHQEPTPRKNGDGNWYNVELNELFPMAPGYVAPPANPEYAAAAAQQFDTTPAWGGGPQQYDQPPY